MLFDGNDILIALHDPLYSGPIAPYLDIAESYQPHMTLGRISDSVEGRRALDEVAARAPRMTVAVRRVISYRRYPDGARQFDNTVDL